MKARTVAAEIVSDERGNAVLVIGGVRFNVKALMMGRTVSEKELMRGFLAGHRREEAAK